MPARWTRPCGAAIALHLLAGAAPALACACCSNTASRYVEVEKLSTQRMAEIERMSFAATAKLATGEADAAIKGVEAPATDYRLAVARAKDRMVFSLRDDKGRAGTLALAIPKIISIFEVDPRGDAKDEGLGPSLYKEWKLTADAVAKFAKTQLEILNEVAPAVAKGAVVVYATCSVFRQEDEDVVAE